MSEMGRTDGYAPIASYAAIGDGRTVALVSRDGSIDWLPIPAVDGRPIFAALLDAEQGGSFTLEPIEAFETKRRYLPDTNVLETTFMTSHGVAKVTDALSLQDGGQLSWTEVVRRIEGTRGRVRFRFELRPRFDFGAPAAFQRRQGALVASSASCALAFLSWDATDVTAAFGSVVGELDTSKGSAGLLVCTCVVGDPIPLPPRREIELRLDRTGGAWQRWLSFHSYKGHWQDAVERSALALKLLISAPTGAIAAAATTSMPERIGGDRNYDYRYAWIRDTALTLDALGTLGYREQVHASLSWLLRASDATHPRLEPFFGLDGHVPRTTKEQDVEGYRGSRPVRHGNSASGQLQLGCYADLLETVTLYVRHGNTLDAETGVRVAETAELVCRIWQNDDSGIWELHELRPYTQSKISCWVALKRALELVGKGEVPDEHAAHWRSESALIRAWIDERCWSDARRSYSFYAGSDQLDAAVLLAIRSGYLRADDERAHATIDAIRDGLSAGDVLLYRYSGQQAHEGAFVACSFWLVEALTLVGRLDEARETMDGLVALGNDVGLYSEEIDPATRDFLGNFPQGLTHLSLINAAVALQRAEERE